MLGDFSGVVDRRRLFQHLGNLEKPVAIDFCSGPEALIDLFASLRQINHLGISVGLADTRNPRDRQRDTARNIHHISGDVMETKTWAQVRKILAGQKADLILESAVGAIEQDRIRTLPIDRQTYGLMINRAWSLLSFSNGTMLCEVPKRQTLVSLRIDMMRWGVMLSEAGIGFQSEITSHDGFIRLTKTPSSPKRLPLLP